MKPKLTLLIVLVLWGLLGAFGPSAYAQDANEPTATPAAPAATPSDNEVNAIAKQMFCPVCENIPLDVCPTTACREWRELIRQKLAEGWTEQQIKDYFVAQYGDRVLAEPPRRGLNWLVYILPVVFFLAGVVVLYTVLRPKRRPASAVGPGESKPLEASAADDPYLAKVEEELRKQ